MRDIKKIDFGENLRKRSVLLSDDEINKAVITLKQLLFTASLEGKSFVDVCCKSGVYCIAAAKLGAKEILGLEADSVWLELARQNIQKPFLKIIEIVDIPILQTDSLKELPKYDIVFAGESVQNVPDIFTAISNALKLLIFDRGSILILHIPGTHTLTNRFLSLKRKYLTATGLRKKRIEFICSCWLFMNRHFFTKKHFFDKQPKTKAKQTISEFLLKFPNHNIAKEEIVEFAKQFGLKLVNYLPSEENFNYNQYYFVKI